MLHLIDGFCLTFIETVSIVKCFVEGLVQFLGDVVLVDIGQTTDNCFENQHDKQHKCVLDGWGNGEHALILHFKSYSPLGCKIN